MKPASAITSHPCASRTAASDTSSAAPPALSAGASTAVSSPSSRAPARPGASARSEITTATRAAMWPARHSRAIAIMFEPRPEMRIAASSGARVLMRG